MEEQAARFWVSGVFVLNSRNMVFFLGQILEGSIRRGMQIDIPLNRHTSVSIPVDAIESADGPGTKSEVALGTIYRTAEERDLILAWNIGDEEVVVRDRAG